MTYDVFGGTLSLTQSINLSSFEVCNIVQYINQSACLSVFEDICSTRYLHFSCIHYRV